jgi:hypothetical protein
MPELPEVLYGVASKIRWAHENIQELEPYAFDISRGNREFVAVEEDVNAGCRVYRLTRDPIIPHKFIIQAAAVLNSLRSALDHVALALCNAGPGGPDAARPKIKQIYFPIADGDAEKYKTNTPSRRVVQALAKPGVIDLIDGIEPYKGGAGNWLYCLDRLNNIDKHRLLIAAALQRPWRTSDKEFNPATGQHMRQLKSVLGAFGLQGTLFWPPDRGGPLKAGDEVDRQPLDGEPDENVNLAFPIAFNEPDIMEIEPIVDALYGLYARVYRLVPEFFAFV